MDIQLDLLNKRINKIEDYNKILLNKIKNIEKNILINNSTNNKQNIIRDNIECDLKIVKKCILMPIIDGEIELFKYLYLDNCIKEDYPIKYINKKLYYWNNEWLEDDDNYLKNTILKNITNLYLKINNLNNFNEENFINNQKRIFDLRDNNNNIKNKWLNNLKKLIYKINIEK